MREGSTKEDRYYSLTTILLIIISLWQDIYINNQTSNFMEDIDKVVNNHSPLSNFSNRNLRTYLLLQKCSGRVSLYILQLVSMLKETYDLIK